jgi:hypothetical protein
MPFLYEMDGAFLERMTLSSWTSHDPHCPVSKKKDYITVISGRVPVSGPMALMPPSSATVPASPARRNLQLMPSLDYCCPACLEIHP